MALMLMTGTAHTANNPMRSPFNPLLEVKDLRQGQILTFDKNIGFYFNASVLRPESLSTLDNLALWLKANPEIVKVNILGHTNQLGSSAYNLTLSRQRARTVRRYLRSQGVEGDRLDALGFGEQKPLVEEKMVEDRVHNRRIELEIATLAPDLEHIKTTSPSATSKAFFKVKTLSTGYVLNPKIAKIKPGQVVIAGNAPVVIKNGPSKFTLMPRSEVLFVRSSHDYNVRRKTVVIKPKEDKPRSGSPWVQALDQPLRPEDDKPKGPQRKTLVTRVLKAGVMGISVLKGTIKVRAKKNHDILIIYPGGVVLQREGDASVTRTGSLLLVKNASKNGDLEVYQDEHPTRLRPDVTFATSVNNKIGFLLPLPSGKKKKVHLHYTKSGKGAPDTVILAEYHKVKQFLANPALNFVDFVVPDGHKQICDATDWKCILENYPKKKDQFVLDIHVSKTPKHYRTTFSLLSLKKRNLLQRSFHKYAANRHQAPIKQAPHTANSVIGESQKEIGPRGRFLRPQLGPDQDKKSILVLSWNYDPPRYEAVTWTGHKMALSVLQDNPNTIGVNGRLLKTLLDEQTGCDRTDRCLEELAGAYGVDHILDGDLVQNLNTPLETDFELRLFESNMMIAGKEHARFRPVNKVLQKVAPMLDDVLEVKELEDPYKSWRATLPGPLRTTSMVGAGLGVLAFSAGSVSYVQYLYAASQTSDASRPIEERNIAYQEGQKAVSQYETYGAALQVTGGLFLLASGALYALTEYWPFSLPPKDSE
ncbi:MAG: hypothetical protein CMH56_13330 [Myxococcales bacterium]|nr:hypothetical protein [Myxococcales bacterium]